MLNDNIRKLRQARGLTQEDLAVQLHVVRQTVSKWEKGLSVPDTDALQRLANALEVDVSQLLDTDIAPAENTDEIAQQLASINEQLIIKNRRTRRVLKIVGIVALSCAALFIMSLLTSIFGLLTYASCLTFDSEVISDSSVEYVTSTDLYEGDSIEMTE